MFGRTLHDTVFAVIAIPIGEKESLEAYEKNLLIAMLGECALALEKDQINETKNQVVVEVQQEKLRANILRAISHDLRTPLTSISGNAGILMENSKILDENKKHRLYVDIYDDSIWLINLVENLLSVTRIENESINLHLEPELLEEVIQEALTHIDRKREEHAINVQLEDDMRPTILDDVHFYSIPHFNIDEVRCLYPELEIKSYESAFQTVCDNIRLNMDNSKVNIVIAHAFISGAELSDSDKSAMIGTANMVSKDVFDGFSYVALGHLHRPQKVDNHIVYSGSPLKYSFGEVTRDKSVMILDTADMTKTKVEIKPINNMRSIKGTYDDVSGDAICSNDYIKIEITDRYIGLEALDFFRSYYPNLLAISGKAASLDNEQMTLSIDDVENLTPLEILNRFFLETLQCEPEKEQIELFNAALTAIDDGGDLS